MGVKTYIIINPEKEGYYIGKEISLYFLAQETRLLRGPKIIDGPFKCDWSIGNKALDEHTTRIFTPIPQTKDNEITVRVTATDIKTQFRYEVIKTIKVAHKEMCGVEIYDNSKNIMICNNPGNQTTTITLENGNLNLHPFVLDENNINYDLSFTAITLNPEDKLEKYMGSDHTLTIKTPGTKVILCHFKKGIWEESVYITLNVREPVQREIEKLKLVIALPEAPKGILVLKKGKKIKIKALAISSSTTKIEKVFWTVIKKSEFDSSNKIPTERYLMSTVLGEEGELQILKTNKQEAITPGEYYLLAVGVIKDKTKPDIYKLTEAYSKISLLIKKSNTIRITAPSARQIEAKKGEHITIEAVIDEEGPIDPDNITVDTEILWTIVKKPDFNPNKLPQGNYFYNTDSGQSLNIQLQMTNTQEAITPGEYYLLAVEVSKEDKKFTSAFDIVEINVPVSEEETFLFITKPEENQTFKLGDEINVAAEIINNPGNITQVYWTLIPESDFNPQTDASSDNYKILYRYPIATGYSRINDNEFKLEIREKILIYDTKPGTYYLFAVGTDKSSNWTKIYSFIKLNIIKKELLKTGPKEGIPGREEATPVPVDREDTDRVARIEPEATAPIDRERTESTPQTVPQEKISYGIKVVKPSDDNSSVRVENLDFGNKEIRVKPIEVIELYPMTNPAIKDYKVEWKTQHFANNDVFTASPSPDLKLATLAEFLSEGPKVIICKFNYKGKKTNVILKIDVKEKSFRN